MIDASALHRNRCEEMRTTVDISDETFADLLTLTGEDSRPKAIKQAVEAYVRREKLERLRKLRGQVDITENDEVERPEIETLQGT